MIEGKVHIRDISRDWKTGKMILTFEAVEGLPPVGVEALEGKTLRLTVKEWKDRRSLDANAYYWVLLSKLADVLRISKPRMHNLILRRYGRPQMIEGQRVILFLPDTEKAEEMALEASTYHLRPTSHIRPGKESDFRAYMLLKGSSECDTAEMSALLDGLIDECREAGIDTATPDQIAEMKAAFRRNHEGKDSEM